MSPAALVLLAIVATAFASVSSETYASDLQAFITSHPELSDSSSPLLMTSSPSTISFPCSVDPSPSVPTSVHQLRPSDIKIVAAVGDSVTAALGAKATSILNLINEWRGVSWSIGGDDNLSSVTTLPNILRSFNPAITGFSVGKTGAGTAEAANNVAITGAIAADLPEQVDNLITILKKNPTSFENDWKVITLWIGGNDLCRFCNGAAENLPENYAGYVFQTLQKIVTSIPLVYVNLVNIIDVTKLASIDSGSCGLLRSQTCKCVAQNEQTTASVQAAALEYQELLAQVAARPELHGDTFTVELQPFMVNAPIPLNSQGKPDTSYLAPDCFHFSTKLHAVAAAALWQNMLQAPSKKSTAWDFDPVIACPTSSAPYLCTSTNNCGASSSPSSSASSQSSTTESSSTASLTIVAAVVGSVAFVVVVVGAALLVRRRKYQTYTVLP